MERTKHANSEGPTADARILALFVTFAQRFGMTLKEAEQASGVSGFEMMTPDARVPDSAAPRLWSAVAAQNPGVVLSLEMSRSAPYLLGGDVAHSGIFAKSLMEALRLVVDNRSLISEELEVQLDVSGADTVFSMSHPMDIVDGGILNEIGIGFAWRYLTEIAPSPLDGLRVEFAHGAHGPLDEYEAYFGPNVQFGAQRNALILPSEELAKPTSQASVELFAFAEEHLRRSRKRLRTMAMPADLRGLAQSIQENAARGRFDTLSVAHGAGMSLRTAQRVASEHGTSLADFIRDSRMQIAKEALSADTMDIHAVASLTGYSDERSFRRAFQSWTGQSPAQFRRANQD